MATATNKESFLMEAESCIEFSSKFYREVVHDIEGNVILSPFSAHIILSYLCHGAAGETASEMINGLSIKDIKELHIGYKILLSTFQFVNEAELNIANGVFVHDNIELLPTFFMLGQEFYNFTISKIKFQNNIESAKMINDWVMDKTNKKIEEIIKLDDITDDTRIILISAVYFKSPWQYAFNSEYTVNRPFYITQNDERQVATMKNKQRYIHGELPELKSKFIEIPYTLEKLKMVVIVPDVGYNLSTLEEKFNWNEIINAKRSADEIILYLPKFKIEYTLNLKNTLEKVGMQSMFEDIADFNGISDVPLKINKIIQKVFIEVHEEGCEAAAATGVQMRLKRALDLTEEFIVDRPFMIIIRHTPSNIPLFIGSIRDIGNNISRDEL